MTKYPFFLMFFLEQMNQNTKNIVHSRGSTVHSLVRVQGSESREQGEVNAITNYEL